MLQAASRRNQCPEYPARSSLCRRFCGIHYVRQMRTKGMAYALAASVAAAAFTECAYGSDETICNFSKPSAFYEQNPDFVRVLNHFGNVLDLNEQEFDDLSRRLVHITDVPAKYFYHDPHISMRYEYGYLCESTGLSSISYKPGARYPSDYSFCFIANAGTLDEGEIFVEKNLFLPRNKWINYLDFPNRDGPYGTFLRTTRLGAMIRFAGVTGFYYLKYGDRYLSVNLSIVAKRNKTTVLVTMFDSTEFVAKQIDCENKGHSGA